MIDRLVFVARVLALVFPLLALFASVETACGESIPEELS
jgi:hypothetical protein